MTPEADIPSRPSAKRIAVGIIILALITMASLVHYDIKSSPEDEPPMVQDKDGAKLVNFPFLDKADYDTRDGDLKVKYPPEMSALDGKKVSVAGFMSPYESLDDMSVFLLMPSSGGCFFCQPPSLSQVVMVRQKSKPGGPAKPPFIQEPIMVTATLHLAVPGSENPSHKAGFIFAFDDAEVKPLTEQAAQVAGLVGAPPPIRK